MGYLGKLRLFGKFNMLEVEKIAGRANDLLFQIRE